MSMVSKVPKMALIILVWPTKLHGLMKIIMSTKAMVSGWELGMTISKSTPISTKKTLTLLNRL